MSFLITPITLAKFNKVRVNLSRKIVDEFRRYNSIPEKNINGQNSEPIQIKVAESVRDSEIKDSGEMEPIIIIEPLVSQSRARGKTMKSKSKVVNSKKLINSLSKKKKPMKQARPTFILPPVQKRNSDHRSLTSTA